MSIFIARTASVNSGTVGHKGRAKARGPRYPESPGQDPPEIRSTVDQQKRGAIEKRMTGRGE